MADSINRAFQHMTDIGLVNVVVLDAEAKVIEARGTRVADWSTGDDAASRLFVLTGMEEVIRMMADPATAAQMGPVELPAVFLGGNHEDGQPGVSVRLSPLDEGEVLLLLRPLDAEGAMDQISVQQHNDLALLRGQLERAQSQAELNVAAREGLFETLQWDFRAPLVTLAQALEEPKTSALAQEALSAIDAWFDLLALKLQEGAGESEGSAIVSPRGLAAALDGVEVTFDAGFDEHFSTPSHIRGSSQVLLQGLKSLVAACPTLERFVVTVRDGALCWVAKGAAASAKTAEGHLFELARSAVVFVGGRVLIEDNDVVVDVPLVPLEFAPENA